MHERTHLRFIHCCTRLERDVRIFAKSKDLKVDHDSKNHIRKTLSLANQYTKRSAKPQLLLNAITTFYSIDLSPSTHRHFHVHVWATTYDYVMLHVNFWCMNLVTRPFDIKPLHSIPYLILSHNCKYKVPIFMREVEKNIVDEIYFRSSHNNNIQNPEGTKKWRHFLASTSTAPKNL